MVDITGAWPSSTPKSPSVPGTTTMWTSSERTSFSGVTSSKCSAMTLRLSLDCLVECGSGRFELVPATGITETDHSPPIERKRVLGDRLSRPWAGLVHGIGAGQGHAYASSASFLAF